MDKVYLYEELKSSLKDIQERLNIKDELVLPKAKTQFRNKYKKSKENLADEEKKFIENYFKEEIKLIKYFTIIS